MATSLYCPLSWQASRASAPACRQIPSSQLAMPPRGFLVPLGPCDFPLITPHPQPPVLPSPSGWHFCHSLRAKHSHTCFYLPAPRIASCHLGVPSGPRHSSAGSCCTHCPHFPTAHSFLSTLLSGSHVCQSSAKSALAVRGAAKSWMRL